MSLKSPSLRSAFRRRRERLTVVGSTERPRLSIYRSSKHVYAQIIDDGKGVTLAYASSRDPQFGKEAKGATVAGAQRVGTLIAERAKAAQITKVVYDRGGRPYHGRIRALAEGARAGGLIF